MFSTFLGFNCIIPLLIVANPKQFDCAQNSDGLKIKGKHHQEETWNFQTKTPMLAYQRIMHPLLWLFSRFQKY